MNEPSADPNADGRPRTAVITCAVVEAEIRHFARGVEHLVHVEVLEQGLHQEPDKLRIALQEAVDRSAIRHNILEFCARVVASSRVTAQDSSVALLDLRGAVGLAP